MRRAELAATITDDDSGAYWHLPGIIHSCLLYLITMNSFRRNAYHLGHWVTQSAQRLTLDLSSGHDLRAVISRPTLASTLGVVPT